MTKQLVEREQVISIVYPLLEIASKYYYDLKKQDGEEKIVKEKVIAKFQPLDYYRPTLALFPRHPWGTDEYSDLVPIPDTLESREDSGGGGSGGRSSRDAR